MFIGYRFFRTLIAVTMFIGLVFSSNFALPNNAFANSRVSERNDIISLFKNYASNRGFVTHVNNVRCGLKNNGCVQSFKDKSGSNFAVYGTQNRIYGDVKRNGAIGQYWISNGWENSKFGYPVEAEKSLGVSRWVQEFEHAFIYYERGKGITTAEKNNNISKQYFIPNMAKVFPTNNLKCALKNNGCVQSFNDSQNNRVGVYSHNNIVVPVFLDDQVIKFWAKNGWENGKFGYPITSRISLQNNGFYYRFEEKTIIFDGQKIIVTDHKDNIDQYLRTRNEYSTLLEQYVSKLQAVIPSDVKCELINNGCVKSYWTADKNRYAVYISDNTKITQVKLTGAIGKHWVASGWENSKFGYPVEAEKSLGVSRWVQEFEHAFIYYERGKGISVVEKEKHQDLPATNEKQNFLNTHSVILNKTVNTVSIDDKDNVQATLNAYNALPANVKEQLSKEKQLLDRFIVKITVLENENRIKQEYLDSNNVVLNKPLDNITVDDKSSVEQAITKYNALPENIKLQLADKKQHLDKLLARIKENETQIKAKERFLNTHSAVLNKTVNTVTVTDKNSVELALADYSKLTENLKHELLFEKQLLDSLFSEIQNKENTLREKQNFLDTHNVLLSKTVDNITVNDKASVQAALNVYSALPVNVKEQLQPEKQLLDSLLAKINELETPEGILDLPTYNKFKNAAPNSQVTQYMYDNEVRTILWVRGVKPLNMQQDGSGDFKRKETAGQYIDYHAPAVNGQGWYDVNKSKTDPADESLCFAATAANTLHWWMKENEEYIKRYIQEQEAKGVYENITNENTSPTRDIRKLVDSYKGQQNSLVFQKFKLDFGDKVTGFYNDIVEDYFINGHTPKTNGGTNISGDEFIKDPRAGFFNEIFTVNTLTDRMYSGRYDVFSRDIKNKISEGKAIAIQHSSFGQYIDHVITLWAAEYNSKGQITAIYVTDSDDQYEETQLGMKRYIVKNVNGIARTTSSINPAVRGAEISYIYTLDLGTNLWEKHFNK